MATYLGKSPARLAIITDDTITSSKILDNTITSADILNATITGADLASDISFTTSGSIAFGDAGENISGDGTDLTITSSGKTIIDSTGDIELDAASGVIDFITSGTPFANIAASNLDLVLKLRQNNKDILFKGLDDYSEITALTLDMSDCLLYTSDAADEP